MVVRHQGIVWERSEKIDYPRHFTSEPHIALGVASRRFRFAEPPGPHVHLGLCHTITRNTSEVVKSPV